MPVTKFDVRCDMTKEENPMSASREEMFARVRVCTIYRHSKLGLHLSSTEHSKPMPMLTLRTALLVCISTVALSHSRPEYTILSLSLFLDRSLSTPSAAASR